MATSVSMEKALSASDTDIVPRAEERRPENGRTSGLRPHWELMLIRPTTVERAFTRGADSLAEEVNMEAWAVRRGREWCRMRR